MINVSEILRGMHESSCPSDYWAANPDILPELELCKKIIQKNGSSVWDHTMSVIDILEVKTPITLLSGLFHDIGKAFAKPMRDKTLSRFPGHENISATIAKKRLLEWGAGSYVIDRIVRLISTHMFDISNVKKEKTICGFIASVGLDNIQNWFILRVADSQSYSNKKQYRNNLIEPFRKSVMTYIGNQPMIGEPKFESLEKSNQVEIEGVDE